MLQTCWISPSGQLLGFLSYYLAAIQLEVQLRPPTGALPSVGAKRAVGSAENGRSGAQTSDGLLRKSPAAGTGYSWLKNHEPSAGSIQG
jgi:hypothetical protein